MSTDLPPQAYTREVLQEAFNWLQEQPEGVRNTVHTPERLVSLYRNSQRLNQVEAPVSSKKFVTDLKSLASSLDQFGGDLNPQPKVQPPAPAPPMEEETLPSPPTVAKAATAERPAPRAPEKGIELDSQSLARVQQVQNRFNLSSQAEAIRLLISLGFEKFDQFQ